MLSYCAGHRLAELIAFSGAIPVAKIFDLLDSPRTKKTGRAARPCEAEISGLRAKNVPAQRPAPTDFQGTFNLGEPPPCRYCRTNETEGQSLSR